MKKFIKENTLTFICMVSIVLIIIPIALFLYHFGGNSISNEMSVWGTFGDFLGGTLNTIISLSSLVILGILTHEIGKDASQNNKEVTLLLKKIEIYDKIAPYLKDIKKYTNKIKQERIQIDSDFASKPLLNIQIHENRLLDNLKFYSELFYTIESFKLSYGHLFSYNFESIEFRNLVYHSQIIFMYSEQMITRAHKRRFPFPVFSEKQIFFERLENDYIKFLSDLQKELRD